MEVRAFLCAGLFTPSSDQIAMTAVTTVLTAVAYHALRPESERAGLADVFA